MVFKISYSVVTNAAAFPAAISVAVAAAASRSPPGYQLTSPLSCFVLATAEGAVKSYSRAATAAGPLACRCCHLFPLSPFLPSAAVVAVTGLLPSCAVRVVAGSVLWAAAIKNLEKSCMIEGHLKNWRAKDLRSFDFSRTPHGTTYTVVGLPVVVLRESDVRHVWRNQSSHLNK